jgi:hypothetical protein
LAKLKGDGGAGVYAVLNAADFEKSAATAEFLPEVIKDLLNNISGKQLVAVVAELAEGSEVLLAAQENIDNAKFMPAFGAPASAQVLTPHNFKLLRFILPQVNIIEAENRLAEIVKEL